MTAPKYTKGKLVVDKCPDNNGYHTIRKSDGSEHGDTSVQPIASAYTEANAARLAHCWNNFEKFQDALFAFVELGDCPASRRMAQEALTLALADSKEGK